MKKVHLNFLPAFLLYGLILPASAQLSFTSGFDSAASPSTGYAAVQFHNFSDAGGQGGFSVGTVGHLNGGNVVNWDPQVWGFSFTYDPKDGVAAAQVFGAGGAASITAPAFSPTELQITVANTGIGDLILSLTSINAVANGGTGYGPIGAQVVGGTENFAPNTTWSAANGETLHAYLNSSTLFSSEFTLNGTVTLDAPANSVNYGDDLNSLIQLNLTSVPEPSSLAIMVSGLGLIGAICSWRKK